MKISAAIITLNEERNIARCIDSLVKIADEIVVMDSFSTDKTKEICLDKGVVFIEQKWLGYAAQKNALNARLKYEMVLSIDADEVLTETLIASILSIKEGNTIGVYQINRLTNYCGKWIKHSGWFPDIKTRLFPNKGTKWVGDHVHEELEFDFENSPVLLNGLLEHYSYFSQKQHRERADVYSRLTAKKYIESGKKPYVFQAFLSGIFRFIQMYIFKLGFLDGYSGFQIAWISACSNVFKYQEVKRIHSGLKEH